MTRAHGLAAHLLPGETVLDAAPLSGGVSAIVTALTLRRAGQEGRRVVLREYGARDLTANPDVAAHEFALLAHLHDRGLPVPQPLAHAPGALIQTFLPGRSGAEVGAEPAQLARFLARLHALPPTGLPLCPLPPVPAPTGPPDEALSETAIRAALATCPLPAGGAAILHGDLWPGNTLWEAGALSAVLDWEDAALGDPLADVGNTRLELLFAGGEAAADAFTAAYAAATGRDLASLPAWDLRAALRPCGRLYTWGLAPAREWTIRVRHAAFVTAALARLAPA